MVVVLVVANWVCDDLVALVLGAQQLLQAEDGGNDEGDFADNQGLECQERETAEESNADHLQFCQEEDWQQGGELLLDFLAASCEKKENPVN